MEHNTAGAAAPEIRPVTTWREAAKVLGMCEDTLCAHRKKYNDRLRRPWWPNRGAVVAWYQALIAPPPELEARPRSARSRAQAGAPLDVRAKVRELGGG